MPFRAFLSIGLVSAAFTTFTGVIATATTDAQAAAPMVRASAPGYYRIMLGDFEVTALSDGTVALPVNKLLTNTTPGRVDKALAKSYLKSPLETSVNAYLVNTGEKLVLIDAGAAGLFGPTLGKTLASLKAAGYQPEQVDEIYITHMHPDHVGGLANGAERVFPNAIVRADKHDADFWLSHANLDKAAADAKGFFQGAMASLKPYVDAGKFQPFEGNTDLVPGIKAVATHGHTLGHAVFVAESKGEKIVFWGDLMHVAAVQFAEPATTIQFDTDSKAAAKQRTAAYADDAKHGYIVAASHLSFPGWAACAPKARATASSRSTTCRAERTASRSVSHMISALRFAFQAPAGLNPVQVSVDIELEQYRCVVARPARRCWYHPVKPEGPKVKMLNEGIDNTNLMRIADEVVETFREQRALASVLSLNESLHPAPPRECLLHRQATVGRVHVFTHS